MSKFLKRNILLLLTLVSANSKENLKYEDGNYDYLYIILGVLGGILCCLLLCCRQLALIAGKPEGADDRWNEQEMAFVNDWIAKNRDHPEVIWFKETKWPVANPVQYKVPAKKDSDETLQMQSYMYPSCYDKDHPDYKGVVFFQHGFMDYAGRFAHLAKLYADVGYDFFAMDVRGHGKSEGQCMFIPDVDTCVRDNIGFQNMVIKTLYSPEKGFQNPPRVFVIGHSFGCMQLLRQICEYGNVIEAGGINVKIEVAVFSAPYFQNHDQALIKYALMFKRMVNFWNDDNIDKDLTFEAKIPMDKIEDFELPLIFDPENPSQRRYFPVRTFISFLTEINRLKDIINAPKCSPKFENLGNLGVMMIRGLEDIIVDNQTVKQIYDLIPGTNKKLLDLPGIGHIPFNMKTPKAQTFKEIHAMFQKYPMKKDM